VRNDKWGQPMDNRDLRHGDFRRIDLNLLVVFDALMEERHVGKAAARVFIGQPAMSHALARLREALHDDMFVRSGNKMEPTALALELAPSVHAWLEEVNNFLFARVAFDLAKVKSTIKLGTLGGIESVLLPSLISTLRNIAPGIRIWTKILPRDAILPTLDSEEIDIAVGPSQLQFKEWHFRDTIYNSRMDCVYSKDQLDLPDEITVELLASLDHISLGWSGDSGSEVDRFFESRGLCRRVAINATCQLAVLRMLRQFPMVSLQTPLVTSSYYEVPSIVVRPVATEGLVLDACLIWHRRNDQHPTQTHLRRIIKEILSKSNATPDAAIKPAPRG